MKVESLIKRKGGSVIEFGYPPKVTKFHFKPESDDIDAPHVCEIPDGSPYLGRLLAITEGYRVYGAEVAEDDSPSADEKADPYADKFDNLHLVNPNDVDGKFLAAFARDVLQVPANSKSAIADLLKKEFDIEVAVARETSNSMIRMALAECVKQAQAEADQLINMQK
ncbi:MAG TPA: hypothetical protein PK782_12480 [Nitrospira sp.]|nr:hypothetical protein [Nitrospira sp.]